MRSLFLLITTCCLVVSTSGQISKTLKKAQDEVDKVKEESGVGGLSKEEIVAGLKEALVKGARKGSDKASKVDGFLKNPDIKIPFPKDAKKVAVALEKIGMEKDVERFVKTLNRSAEMAAAEVKPIFVDAIKVMSVNDAVGILNGEDKRGATNYLKNSSSNELRERIGPLISKTLDETDATKYYKALIKKYNKLPFVTKKNANLDEYATQKTLDGLFFLVGAEEEKIRDNPAARTSDLLKKVF
ncbi:MAG: DUF4197 domain-containing protein, partial [Cytophagales bacterium]|nr:DUF4197 domain-containing protein [Cytophagales bacterium]